MDTPSTVRAYNLGLKAVPNFASLSLAEIEYYEKHLEQLSAAIIRGFVIPVATMEEQPKFSLIADLGIIRVPPRYEHSTRLAWFRSRYGKKLSFYDEDIFDQNFTNPSRILKPRDKLRVRVFKQNVKSSTGEERIAFLIAQGAVFTGAQGASLALEFKRDRLPENGGMFLSMDKEECLPNDQWKKVPCINRNYDRSRQANWDFLFSLGSFNMGGGCDGPTSFCLLCFTDAS